MVESGNTVEPTSAKTKATRGDHTAVFKAKVIHQIQTDVSQDEIGRKYGISQSLVSKWMKDKKTLLLQQPINTKSCMPNRENRLNIWSCTGCSLTK